MKEQKKNYFSPQIDIILFLDEDVITCSGNYNVTETEEEIIRYYTGE